MSLADKLRAIREGAVERIPADMREKMERAVDELRGSEIERRALTVGDKIPGFEIPNVEGSSFSSADLLASGPLVITFYRGDW